MLKISKSLSDALTGPTIRVMDHIKVTEGTAQMLKAHNSPGFVLITEDGSGGQEYFFSENFREAARDWLQTIADLENK